jgi:hypothetical protein
VDGTAPRAATGPRLHTDRYAVGEAIYVEEVDPLRRADLVVDNTDLDHPRLV